jgi:WD40 repeat protein
MKLLKLLALQSIACSMSMLMYGALVTQENKVDESKREEMLRNLESLRSCYQKTHLAKKFFQYGVSKSQRKGDSHPSKKNHLFDIPDALWRGIFECIDTWRIKQTAPLEKIGRCIGKSDLYRLVAVDTENNCLQENCEKAFDKSNNITLALVSDGEAIMVGDKVAMHLGHRINCFSMKSGDLLKSLYGHRNVVSAITALSHSPEKIASGDCNGAMKIWDLESWSCEKTWQAHEKIIHVLAMLPNGTLTSGSDDRTIKLWDTASEKCIATLSGHTAEVTGLVALKNGNLLSISKDDTIKMWDPVYKTCLTTIKVPLTIAQCIALPSYELIVIDLVGCVYNIKNNHTTRIGVPKQPTEQRWMDTLTSLKNGAFISHDTKGDIHLWQSLPDFGWHCKEENTTPS